MRNLCQRKQGSGGTEEKNSIWEWGEGRLHGPTLLRDQESFPGPTVLMPEYANPKDR